MKLNKIIVGLTVVGLSNFTLASVGDGFQGTQVGATIKDTASSTLRLCNFNNKTVTYLVKGINTPVSLSTGTTPVEPGLCKTVTLRGPTLSPQITLTIPGFTIDATLDGSAETAHVEVAKGISQIDAKFTQELAISAFTPASDNKLTIYDKIGTTTGEHPVAVTGLLQEQNSSPIGADYTFCSGSNGSQCNDTAGMQ